MHTGSPFWLRRHNVVVVVPQFAQFVPARRAADCKTSTTTGLVRNNLKKQKRVHLLCGSCSRVHRNYRRVLLSRFVSIVTLLSLHNWNNLFLRDELSTTKTSTSNFFSKNLSNNHCYLRKNLFLKNL